MNLKTFLENITIDDEYKVQYFTRINDTYNIVILFDTIRVDCITKEELVKRYGNRQIETIFIDTVRNKCFGEYPQIVIEIEEE